MCFPFLKFKQDFDDRKLSEDIAHDVNITNSKYKGIEKCYNNKHVDIHSIVKKQQARKKIIVKS